MVNRTWIESSNPLVIFFWWWMITMILWSWTLVVLRTLWNILLGTSWMIYLGAILLGVVGFLFGYLLSMIFGLDSVKRRTVSLETGIKNTPLTATIILISFPDMLANQIIQLPIFYGLIIVFTSTLATLVFRIYFVEEKLYPSKMGESQAAWFKSVDWRIQ